MRTLLYARYSSQIQNARSIEDQVALLRSRADREGWTIVDVFTDYAISGAAGVGAEQRPGLHAMLALADRIERAKPAGNHDLNREERRDENEAVAAALGIPATVKIGHEITGNLRTVPRMLPNYVGSLDAAQAVVPPGPFWTWIVSREGTAIVTDMTPRVSTDKLMRATPEMVPHPRYQAAGCSSAARALVVAGLRARASMEGNEP